MMGLEQIRGVFKWAVCAAGVVLLAGAAPALAADPVADASPQGANNFNCRPSAAHPNPVVLVHGLGANMQGNWSYMSPRLASAGYCVFALTYARQTSTPPPFNEFGGLAKMEDSAQNELAPFVDRVLTATSASKVDIVGHSEGSLMPNYY